MTDPSVIEATRREVDLDALRLGAPMMEATVRSPAVVVDADTKEPILVTAPFPGDLAEYRRACLGYPRSTTIRTGGIRNISRTFGFLCRRGLVKRQSCRPCEGVHIAPEAHNVIAGAAGALGDQLAALAPGHAAHARELVRDEVLPEWLLDPAGWWTSGVVNFTSALPYHYDGANFDAWSAMVVVRRGARGGHLHVPEYDLVVDCRDGDVIYFNGNDLMHGVTPIVKLTKDAYRISAVYYPVRAMRHCLPWEEELERGRVRRSSMEADLMDRQRRDGSMA